MKIAFFDCFAGISGDMALGALLDCGVPVEDLRAGLSSLPVSGWEISVAPVLKSGIHAQQVRIALHGQNDAEELAASTRASHHAHGHSHHEAHSHEAHSHTHQEHLHSHDHAHEGEGEHSHSDSHSHSHHHGRSMREIREIIESSGLSARVKRDSLQIFSLIAQAEAKMHHSTPDDVHFHEIGGIDSLLDICGVAWCLEYLGVEEIHCSALPNFSGTVVCAHGTMPLPAPATLELLRGVPLVPSGLRGEMVTPTGAAIVAALSQSFDAPPAFSVDSIGAGAGTKNWPDRPNLLRVVLGKRSEAASTCETSPAVENAGLQWRTLSQIETNIDDMNPEFFAFVTEHLLESGALDAWLEPIQMKKNRPATLLRVLAAPEDQEKLVALILRETTSLGVRVTEVRRAALARRESSVETRYGAVRVKEAQWHEGGVLRVAPEYDDVAACARQHNVSPREVYEAAQQAMVQAKSHEAA